MKLLFMYDNTDIFSISGEIKTVGEKYPQILKNHNVLH